MLRKKSGVNKISNTLMQKPCSATAEKTHKKIQQSDTRSLTRGSGKDVLVTTKAIGYRQGKRRLANNK